MKKTRNLILIFAFIFFCVTVPVSHAEKTAFNAGIVNDYKFSGNQVCEYAKSCMNSIFKYTDNPSPNYSETNLKNGTEALNSGSIDFLFMVPMHDILAQHYDYIPDPVATGFLALYTKSETPLYFEDFKSFNNMKIGMMRGTVYEARLQSYSNGRFTYTPVYYDNISDLISGVYDGSVDAIFTPTTEKPEGLRIIAKCGNIQYYCMVRKGDKAMYDTINSALTSMEKDSPFYFIDEFKEFFKIPYHNTVAFTDDEYKAVRTQEKLRVLTPDDDYPLSYFDKDTKEYSGVYVEIIKTMAENAGINLEFIPYNKSEMSMNGIMMGKADAVLTVSGSKQGVIKATDPYTSISYMPIGRDDVSVFEDSALTVGICDDDSWITDYLEGSYPNWNIVKYSSVNSLLRAAERKKISAALISSPDMQTKTSLIAHPKLSIISDFTVDVPVSLGISDITCVDHIVRCLNKTIHSVSVSQAELEGRVYTLSHIYVPNFRDMLYANKFWIIALMGILVLIFAAIKWREIYFRRLSHIDQLTRIPNRRYFEGAVIKMMEKNPDKQYLLASIDAKNFKLINDRYSQDVGDQTLMNIAANIQEMFKEHGLYARSHGDNFLVFTEDTPENRYRLDRLTDMDIHIHSTSKYQVPIKIGVCPISGYNAGFNMSHFIDRANIAKTYIPGRNTNDIRYFTEEMGNDLERKNSMESEMNKALENGDFVVYYQPKYDLESDMIIGAEALVRWDHKERGMISPGLFIPLFEKNGFIIDLDFYVYEAVLKMIKKRLKKNKKLVPISMNVSRCHLDEVDFIPRLEALVDKYKVPKKYIEMEITESIFSREDSSAISLMYNLKEHGFMISMDDFGSGYSSLNLLRKVPIDTLKIDKEFIDNSDDSSKSHVIIEEIICMAAKIRVKTICEGVETREQRDFLKKAGCNMVQGFFYSRPLPYYDFEKLLDVSC